MSAALAGLESEQTEHDQAPLSSLSGGVRPAADQSKLFNGEVGGAVAKGVKEAGASGGVGGREEDVGACLGASQIVHFSFASAGFCRQQTEHVHVCVVVSAFIPAADQLKLFDGAIGGAATTGAEEVDAGVGVEEREEGVDACRGASQIVHFSFASAGFCRQQSEHVHVCAAVGAFIPAAVQLNPFIAHAGAMVEVNS